VSSPFFNVHGGVSFNVPLDADMFYIFVFAFQSQKLSLPLPLPFLGYFQKFVPPHFSQCSYATENILFPIHSKYMLAQEKRLIPHWKRCTTISWNPHIPWLSLKKKNVLRFVEPYSPFPLHTRFSATIESFFFRFRIFKEPIETNSIYILECQCCV